MPLDLRPSLSANFGFSDFRPGQEQAIQNLLQGRHTLAVMPTGAGKSLIFQLTGLLLPGLTLVVSPLIALMKDQVDSLQRAGIAATFINSALPATEQAGRLRQLASGSYRIVYIAPERLRNKAFLSALRRQTISLLAVDEAHCISEWGHDFRPDYLHIARARALMGSPLTVALTATATPRVQQDIIHSLGLGDSASVIVTGFNRPNLSLNVLYLNGLPAKLSALKELLLPKQDGAVIIYTGTRRDAEEVAEFVCEVVKIPAEYYHAGLPSEERTRIQEAFISGQRNVIVATNAFGMGIDRADVRQVIHFSLPGSLEAYYQEAGRAGRDGLPARGTLLFDPKDRALQEFFIKHSVLTAGDLELIYKAIPAGEDIWITLDDLSRMTGLHPVQIKVGLSELERAGALEHVGDESFYMIIRPGSWNAAEIDKAAANSQLHLEHRQKQLDGMVNYAESNACRRKIILGYFGDTGAADALDCCDNCRNRPPAAVKVAVDVDALTHGERAALIILDCARRLKNLVGKRKLAQILKGSKAEDMQKFHYDKSVYYARLAVFRQCEIERMIEQLVSLGYFKLIGGTYPVVSLTPKGENAIVQKETIELKLPVKYDEEKIESKKAELEAGGTVEYTARLFKNGLKPEQIAQKRGFAVTSIYGHLAQLIANGILTVEQIVPADIIQKVEAAIKSVGSPQYLAPINQILNYEIDYNIIRCVVAGFTLKSSKNEGIKTENPEPIQVFLSRSHPRPLSGPWQTGWALDFNSRFSGGDWSRSEVGDLTYRLKYQADASAIPALIRHTTELVADHPQLVAVDAILPVPPSLKREFEPVYAFCEALSSEMGKPMLSALTKTRPTQPQKQMNTLAQKRANVNGAFALNKLERNLRLLVIDDLFDSGTTLEEITHLLLRAGAACVNVLALTRTIHSDA